MVGESGGAMHAPHPFLLEDRELRLPVGQDLGDAGVLVLQRDELGLPLDPRALELGRLGLLGGDVLLDVDDRRLERPRVLVELLDAGALGHHLLELLVEEVDLVLLLLDLGVAAAALRFGAFAAFELTTARPREPTCKHSASFSPSWVAGATKAEPQETEVTILHHAPKSLRAATLEKLQRVSRAAGARASP